MKKIFLLFVAVAMSAGMVFAQDINQATENYNNGAMELQMGNNDAAIGYFQTALEMAEALGEEGAEVATNCRNIIPAVYLASAKEMIKAEQYDPAVDQLKKAIEAAGKYETPEVADDANELMPQVYVSKASLQRRTSLRLKLHTSRLSRLTQQTVWLISVSDRLSSSRTRLKRQKLLMFRLPLTVRKRMQISSSQTCT